MTMKKKDYDISTIGGRIRRIRLARKYEIATVSYLTGIHINTLGLYENNKSMPSAINIGKIAQALTVTTDYLILGKSY